MNIALLTGVMDKNLNEASKITTHSLARELQGRNNRVVIICSKHKGELKKEIINDLLVYRFNLLLIPFGIFLVQKKENIKFNILHSFSSAPISILKILPAKLFLKIKIIHTIKSESAHWLGTLKLSFFLNLANNLTVHSNSLKEKLKKHVFKKISVIPSHINTKKFKVLNKKYLRKKYGINKPVVLYYGPFAPRKGTDLLIKTIPEVVKKRVNILFIFLIKHTKYFEKSMNQIKDLNLPNNVKVITNELYNIPEWINISNVAVFPYPNLKGTEATPSCILECLACNTPVITRNLKELRSEINSNYLSFFNKNSELVESINHNLNKTGKNTFNKKKYSLKLICNKYLEIYSR